MVKDPMAAMKDLYSHFGLEMTPDTEKAMQDPQTRIKDDVMV